MISSLWVRVEELISELPTRVYPTLLNIDEGDEAKGVDKVEVEEAQSLALPKTPTPETTTTRDKNFSRVKHISSPPTLPQNIKEVTTNTKTACNPFITPADVAPPGKFFKVWKNVYACTTFDSERDTKILKA
eukprot:CAMPEP_0194286614 /NCGR_PEP_ID=MMETSP0169-20130528/32879_1 /TAXON_ID=218684 /ORGANISM="Corethron pennatum, Strain L29A3" /LENGTH=131 /DNA_ID=CAMNT_0039033097 /DNA_START=33 /DNA_END=429 /DNA_ORIENTATION=+